MNIQFTIMAHGLIKAAAVEKALKDIGVPFEAKEAKSVANGKARRTRVVVTKKEVLAVATRIADNPEWTDKDVSDACGVSRATVGRIRHGKHALQRDVEEIR